MRTRVARFSTREIWGAALAALLVGFAYSGPACAERVTIAPGGDVQAALARAADGDVILLAEGVHRGPVRIEKEVTLEGQPGAVLEGSGRGSVVTLSAPRAVVRGLTVRGSGRDLEAMDAGVFVQQSATEALVEGNRLEGNLYGVYLHGAEDAVARGNVIVGLQDGRVNEAGNGVSVWNAPGARVEDNDIRFGRDGIFAVASKRNVFRGNRFRDLRFAVHYMYTNDGEVVGNVSVGNTVGFAIMYSHRLIVRDNVSDGDLNHGFLFNFANSSEIAGNTVRGRQLPASRWATPGLRGAEAREHGLPAAEEAVGTLAGGVRNGPEKCVFIYNANKNTFQNNWFEGCEIGVHFTAGSEGNAIVGNAFIRNRNQVKYVGTRYLDWSKDGRGNYWSDNPAFDLNGDGVGDAAYRPNDIIDKVLWTAPQAKVLVNSPAVQIIRWAQSQFPALLPGGVVDSRPLMAPAAVPRPDEKGAAP
ncbi:MAG TPA: nitrous oxide reductase family maturation protein NosD [Hyphomicrobium sp.]|nr:nitrous oxide reductase family maturation protein NosD [Hyphomicrobium sp.]